MSDTQITASITKSDDTSTRETVVEEKTFKTDEKFRATVELDTHDVIGTPSATITLNGKVAEDSSRAPVSMETKDADDNDVKVEVDLNPPNEKSVTIAIARSKSFDQNPNDNDGPTSPVKVRPLTDEEVEAIVSKYRNAGGDNLDALLEFFWSVDTFRFGAFTVHQLAWRLRSAGHWLTNKHIARMFSDLDKDNDLVVSLDEFLTDMTKPRRRPLSNDELKTWFDRFDGDSDGYVTRDDIRDKLAELGRFILTPQLDELMRHDRRGRKEKLDFKEFCLAYTMDN